MNNDWIYIGADINNMNWSKVGKTTNGLHTRHTSSQRPGYFIYTAFNIVHGSVHDIEADLLKRHLPMIQGLVREIHFSTGNASECFRLNPNEMTFLVESFISQKYSSCVTYENLLHGRMSRYQCDNNVFQMFNVNPFSQPIQTTNLPKSLGLTGHSYFTGNQEIYEVDLGDGYYVDIGTGMQKHVDDD
ncbi:hypothetical protein MX824_004884 [Vibrio parahaemolyticus]|uniref:hypothetical protein n=1 Tax=Vibrio parahaemolyticus TaxID=670 RepID=UPI0004A4920B|nr:hypothetical protein [Vibrio parahaemolyticus]EJC6766207.1 hypothetical protein [Vibrio parahaemolyticus]EJC6785002.1 hypothetical protein [Vibrio parahaemolyticus]EJC6813352.1 hypothetical protein [Vibrio parahaemolyticus]EJC6928001.1 hypothetical protein [Vibrio parahaemolyticus]EJC6942342.1 hypothetical protein [Vibrio parahaemolyticus]